MVRGRSAPGRGHGNRWGLVFGGVLVGGLVASGCGAAAIPAAVADWDGSRQTAVQPQVDPALGGATGGEDYADSGYQFEDEPAPAREESFEEVALSTSRGGGSRARRGPPEPPPPANDALPSHPGTPTPQADPTLAQNTASAGESASSSDPNAQSNPETVSDTRNPIIYTATLYLGVFDVAATQDAIVESIRALDGFLMRRTDRGLVVRVPARRFRDAIGVVSERGDVLRRDISAEDVSEEFHDVTLRIRNAIVMRERLEALLARADDVAAALQIERELQRLTALIETLRGRQRFLADRVQFSTITIHFTPMATESNDAPGFRLPFPWLDRLGLQNLTRL